MSCAFQASSSVCISSALVVRSWVKAMWPPSIAGPTLEGPVTPTVLLSGRRLELGQPPVGECGRHRALADGPCHALRRPVADVACGEEARHARLERERVAVERPVRGPLACAQEVWPREDV